MSIFNHFKGRKSLFFISKCSGHIIISYMEVYSIFCTRMEVTEMFVMSLDFAEIKNIENMSVGMTYKTHLQPKRVKFTNSVIFVTHSHFSMQTVHFPTF